MILSGDEDALDPILTAIHDLVDELAEEHDASGHSIHEETLQLVLMALGDALLGGPMRSEEHTSELQSLMRISYAVFCLKKKKTKHSSTTSSIHNTLIHNKKSHT